jgi:hypothetical protein
VAAGVYWQHRISKEYTMNILRLSLIAATLLFAACATNRTERTAEQLQRYLDAAGEPVPSFRYFSFHAWTPLGKDYLAVWTKPREAWLIQLMPLCHDLEFAHSIALTSSLNRVYARFDKIIVRDYTCRIQAIRPIDVTRLRDLQNAAREQRNGIEARNSDQPHEEGDAH